MRRKKSRFFKPSNNIFLQIARDFDEVCPNCESIHISVRRRKIPKYYCQICKNEFDDPKAEFAYITQKQRGEIGIQHPNPDR